MSDTPRKLSLNKLSLKRDSAPEAPKLEERLHKVLAQAGLGRAARWNSALPMA